MKSEDSNKYKQEISRNSYFLIAKIKNCEAMRSELDALDDNAKRFLIPMLFLWLYYVQLAASELCRQLPAKNPRRGAGGLHCALGGPASGPRHRAGLTQSTL